MTIINSIECDIKNYVSNTIKKDIQNNKPLESKLNVIIVISNPCQYARRYILAREFVQRIENEEKNVNLFIVELVYDKKHKFLVTKPENKNHLQIRTDTAPLWHKENMINMGVAKLLPKDWKAFAWIDADIEFNNPHWALDTLKVLNGKSDIVQLFDYCSDLDQNEDTMGMYPSFCYQYINKRKYNKGSGLNQWHPGYAWAMTRKAYDQIGGLYDLSILGSGDHNMSLSWINNSLKSLNGDVQDSYKKTVQDFELRSQGLQLGYVPGLIRHHFHGSKKFRFYNSRWLILVKHKYDPNIHIKKNKDGLIIPTKECPIELLNDILHYFSIRNEDECFINQVIDLAI